MRFARILTTTLLATAAMTASAVAGGYSRGSANLDPFFETGTSYAAQMTVVSPTRGYETINGTPASAFVSPFDGSRADRDFAETYVNAGATVAFDIAGGFRCGGSIAQPYGAKTDYGFAQIITGTGTTTSAELGSLEIGGTCAYGMDVGPGKLHVLGGLFYQNLTYDEARGFGFGSPFGGGDLAFDDGGLGYRLGLGYTIPEIALKATLVYRSSVDHTLTGVVRNPAFPTPGSSVNGFADAETPQSVKLSLQSGIAPGWLAFGSVEWADWSVIQRVQVFANPGQLAPIAVPLAGVTVDAFFKDGWTVTGGVGHKFNDQWAGTFSITWDKGTSGADNPLGIVSSYSDSWTFAVGAAYDATPNVSIRGGLAYSILEDHVEVKEGGARIGYGTDHAIGGGLQIVGKF